MSGKLQHELKKSKPFDSLEQEVYLNLLRTIDALSRGVTDLFKLHGLSSTQYNALRILRGAGKDGLPCQEVGARMVTRDPDITRLFDRLEARDLITRQRQTDDRRVVRAYITDAGLKLLKSLDQPVLDLHKSQLHHLGRENLKILSDLLELAREREA
jgi:DNA-binding MarR family transcriptional regulator